MAVTIKFGNIAKRRNSTYVPTAAEMSAEYSVALKDGCSETAPVFLISASAFAYNYAQWGTWYYFVTNIEYTRNNLFTVTCEIDPLATFKTEILATSAFVAYDTAANSELPDKRLSAVTSAGYVVNTSGNFNYIGRGACVALDVVGTNGSSTYLVSVSDAATILNGISTSTYITDYFKDIVWDDTMPADEALVDVLTQFGQNVVNCISQLIAKGAAPNMLRGARLMGFSSAGASWGTANQQVYLGAYPTGVYGTRLDLLADTSEIVQVSIPWTFSDWRRNAPYTQLYVYSPYFGLVELPTSDLIGKGQIDCTVSFSPVSGDALFMLTAVPSGGGSSIRLGHYSCNLSAPHLIGSANVSAWTQSVAAMQGALGIVGGVVAGGAAGAIIGTKGITGMLDHVRPLGQTTGTAGGSALIGIGLPPPLTCIEITHDTNVSPSSVSAIMGTPTNAVKSLSGLTGYVETVNASVAAAVEESVLETINNMLDAGIYIE